MAAQAAACYILAQRAAGKSMMPDFVHSAETRLAIYGTLAPGRANHHLLADLRGRWLTGAVRGRLVEEGWGAAQGFPAIVLDESAAPVACHVFESKDLPAHWARLDAFEGEEYERVTVAVTLDNGKKVEAMIYVAANANPPSFKGETGDPPA